MLSPLLLLSSAAAFSPCNGPAALRQCSRVSTPTMSEASSRRQALAGASAAVIAGSMVQGAQAKAGQFSKQSLFGVNDMSSPFQVGGPQSGEAATYGYKSTGEFLANGYEADVTREKASFLESADRLTSKLEPKIESKTWWFVRDELRIQAYQMRSSMIAINKVSPNKAAADKAYKTFWSEVESLDLACQKKEQALAQKEYADVVKALAAYKAAVL